ncbi:class I SAM-dependent methyltransferase [Ectothiorhodospira variabilis]|uniref:class I SAM-dependent methyltransferase n=1 Tax=Ectothiorhodospira variabilis TaxID=505694 RepID=UPI001EFB1CB3|nr:class I SAM-dependent methyltransferase [Ectothiorhodospira variabilis]MCG5497538.1 methyltransferase domain-containing protein [Ectothiorhodospira variabilis]
MDKARYGQQNIYAEKMNKYRKLRNLAWRLSMRGLPRGPHITRYYMYNHLHSIRAKLPTSGGRALSISGSEDLSVLTGLQPSEIVTADYPEHNLLSLDFDESSFDFVLTDQVLEHVEGNPQQAIDECYRVLRPGGIAIHTTCFINPIHYGPKDLWRFSPDALLLLHSNWQQIIDVGGWGNCDVWSVVKDGLRFTGVPNAKWHPLHKLAIRNDPLWPIVTWIVAKK